MKRKIRNNVFETNSSSVHSITISKEGREPSKLEKDKDGYIKIDFGTFDKDYHIYDTQYDKLSYLITCFYYLSGYDICNIYDNYEYKELEKIICNYADAKGIRIINKEEPYIDHQSQPYNYMDFINIYDEDEVIDFVFNKYAALKTTCD